MIDCLLPKICTACGHLSFDATPHVCTADPVTAFGEDDALLTAILTDKLPIDLAADNLRDTVRNEGVASVRAQMGELCAALTNDLVELCADSLTHRHVDREYVSRAVRGHLTKIAARCAGAES